MGCRNTTIKGPHSADVVPSSEVERNGRPEGPALSPSSPASSSTLPDGAPRGGRNGHTPQAAHPTASHGADGGTRTKASHEPPPPSRSSSGHRRAALPMAANNSRWASCSGSDGPHAHGDGEEDGLGGERDSAEWPVSGNHFDPIAAPPHARQDSHESDANPDHVTPPNAKVELADKTGAMQAAQEYQSRVQAKKLAEDARAARLQVELFDPIRPVDSFNVTHRALLGRCWDRRVAEVAPVSFVHTALTLEAAVAMEAAERDGGEDDRCGNASVAAPPSQSAADATRSSPPLFELFSAVPPASGASLLRRQLTLEPQVAGALGICSPRRRNSTTNANGSGSTRPMTAELGAAIGAGGVPRRSHWFSVVGISTNLLPTSPTSAGTPCADNGTSGGSSQETASRKRSSRIQQMTFPPFPTNTTSTAAFQAVTKEFPMWARPDEIAKLPMADRVNLAIRLMACSTRYYGMKSAYAFRVSDEEVAEESETDAGRLFLRRCGLSPARGVKVVRWNRVEFVNPNFLTLTKAVAKTQGIAHLTAAAFVHSRPARDDAFGLSSTNPAGYLGNGSLSLHRRGRSRPARGAMGGSTLSLDSETEAPLALPRRSAPLGSHNVSNLSFLGQHLIASGGETVSFAALAASSASRSGGSLQGPSSGHGCSGLPNGSFLHRSLVGHPLQSIRGGGGHKGISAADGDEAESEWGIATHSGALASCPCRFPEDSVLCLVMEIPPSRMPQLPGVPLQVQLAAEARMGRTPVSNTSHSAHAFPSGDDMGSGSKLRHTPSTSSLGPKSPVNAAPRGSSASPPPVGLTGSHTDPLLIALNISSFSASVDPFRWEENRYVRYPVDVDGYKRSSRRDYGEGVVTDIMYGGVLVIECSCAAAVVHLLSLLRGMKWAENDTPAAIVGDVLKRVKQYREALLRGRKTAARRANAKSGANGNRNGASNAGGAASPRGHDEDVASLGATSTAAKSRTSNVYVAMGLGGTDEADATLIESFRYRISRRIGGRPMRDAVELKQISVYLGDTVMEQSQTLSRPSQESGQAANGSVSYAGARHGREGDGAVVAGSEVQQQQTQLDPDITPSFSRVASAWVGLPAISAVMRTWGVHLLANPQLAQPISFFLQRFSGVAPVVQHTALSSLFHMGGTPTDECGADNDLDDEGIQFFENDMGARHGAAATTAADSDAFLHLPPVKRISKFNPFYTSLPGSAKSSPSESAPLLRKSASRETVALDHRHHPDGHEHEHDRDHDDDDDGPPPAALSARAWSRDTLARPEGSFGVPSEGGGRGGGHGTVKRKAWDAEEEDAFQNEVIDSDSDNGAGEGPDPRTPMGHTQNLTFTFTDSAELSLLSPHHSMHTQAAAPPPPPPPGLRTQRPSLAGQKTVVAVPAKEPVRSGASGAPSLSRAATIDTAPPSPVQPPSDAASEAPPLSLPSSSAGKRSPGSAAKRKMSGGARKAKKGGPARTGAGRTKGPTASSAAVSVDDRRGSAATTATTATATPLSGFSRQPSLSHGQEMENLWRIAELEVKAQRQELAELQAAKRKAEEEQAKLLEEMHALRKAFLPNTTVQELDLAFLYLKTALFESEDLPNSRVYFNSADWMPMLTALWTSPANCIRSVEVAFPLQSRDLPKIGIVGGLLFHRFAAGPLEHLEINAGQMLGSASAVTVAGGSSSTAVEDGDGRDRKEAALGGKKKRSPLLSRFGVGRKQKRKNAHDGDEEDGSEYEPLVFCSPSAVLGGRGPSQVLGPGTYSPPFYVSPEQARDTLWLLLCAIAENATCVEFRLCLRGFPTLLSAKDQEKVRKEEAEQNQVTAAALVASAGKEKLKPSLSLTDFFTRHRRTATVEQHLALTNSFQLREDTLNLDGFVVNTSMLGPGKASPDSSLSPVQTYTTFSQNASLAASSHTCEHLTGTAGGSSADNSSAPTPVRPNHRTAGGSHNLFLNHEGSGAVLPPLGSGAMPQHLHRVARASWMHADAHALVLPFYTILFHRCPELPVAALSSKQRAQQQRIAAACQAEGLAGALLALADGDNAANPHTLHYHNEYTLVHNNGDFYIPPSRQRKLAELAVQAALAHDALLASSTNAVAGELTMADAMPMTPLAAPGTPHDGAKAGRGGRHGADVRTAPSSAGWDGLCESWGMHDRCLANRSVFGLKSAAEEAAVYAEEEARLVRHSDEIWAVLRKATHGYNKASAAATAGSGAATASRGELDNAAAHAEPSKWRRAIILER